MSDHEPVGAAAYIALGSNLGDRAGLLAEAIRRLGAAGTVEAVSSLYETEAWGYEGGPPFLNAALRLRTQLEPVALLHMMQIIEMDLGRERSVLNAPRTLDLDLLLYDDAVVALPGLRVPHPRLHERAFVLVPLT
ncbi:MAG: 2-amino-4-hydroxy-6-hydroxymethyldihydropteridine diphosphokinase, partial [Thermomicrobiales bacterium]|nr:2-amino-4-hydroxy-6-hydroxymethyldihydropteridine diphosphokinase [Thermomicrobiales bacterium]